MKRHIKIFAVMLFIFAPYLAGAPGTGVKIEFSNLARVLFWEETPGAINYRGVKLHSGRETIGPEERWMDILVKLDSVKMSLDDTRLNATVRRLDSGELAATISSAVLAPDALVRVDMRSLAVKEAELCVEWTDTNGTLLGRGVTGISAEQARPLEAKRKIPVTLDFPEGSGEGVKNYPVRFGLPLPRGSVWDGGGLRVTDAGGKELPSQVEITGRWAEEGSVKWMWVDALVSSLHETIFMEAGERTPASSPAAPVKLEESAEGILVKTGDVEYLVTGGGALLKKVLYRGRVVAQEGGARGLYVVDQHNRLAKACGKDADVRIESYGPLSSVVRIEGFYRTLEGEELARHITRLNFFAGRPEVHATHTLILTRDTNEVWFRDIGWEFEAEAGENVKALFGLSPANTVDPVDRKVKLTSFTRAVAADNPVQPAVPSPESLSVSLEGGKRVSMLQKDGIRLGLRPPRTVYLHGENLFEVREAGSPKPLHEGSMMGDWAAVAGSRAGWLMSCRDAAAQHPKEFEAEKNRLTLKLFSPASGRELDFRMESLMKNWGMLPAEKIAGYYKKNPEMLEAYLSFIIKHSTNAVGWAKTHEILLSPFAAPVNPAEVSSLHSGQVFAHVSPEWIRETLVLGALHPRDRENFPAEETVIENFFWGKVKQGNGGANGGFIDYNAGPHWVIHDWRSGSYSIRSDSWYLYARSGERELRKFAQGANRAWLDNNFSHWEAPGKMLGLIVSRSSCPGIQANRTRKADLPLYWDGSSMNNYESSTVVNLDQAYLDYYMTGYRRAGDIMNNFAKTARENMTGETRQYRVILAVRHIMQAYEFTWEPRLKELIYEMVERYIYDPGGEILLSKGRPYRNSTYKLQTDGDVFVLLSELFGDRIFHRLAMTVSEWNWDTAAIYQPRKGAQNRATGYMGYFLWKETGDPSVAARFDYARRSLVSSRLVDPATGMVSLTCISQIPRYFKGLPIAMDVAKEMEKKEKSSWLSFITDTPETSIFIIKPGETTYKGHYASVDEGEISMNILVNNFSGERYVVRKEYGLEKPPAVGGLAILKPHTFLKFSRMNHDLHTVKERGRFLSKINIPKDSPGGVYEVEISGRGEYGVFTDKSAPLALYAPDGWTLPAMNPPVRTYFNVPGQNEKGRIFFEKGACLFTPGGEAFRDGEKVSGWIELPQDKPGLWSFESIEECRIKTENLPGFFAMGSPDFYMEYNPEK